MASTGGSALEEADGIALGALRGAGCLPEAASGAASLDALLAADALAGAAAAAVRVVARDGALCASMPASGRLPAEMTRRLRCAQDVADAVAALGYRCGNMGRGGRFGTRSLRR